MNLQQSNTRLLLSANSWSVISWVKYCLLIAHIWNSVLTHCGWSRNESGATSCLQSKVQTGEELEGGSFSRHKWDVLIQTEHQYSVTTDARVKHMRWSYLRKWSKWIFKEQYCCCAAGWPWQKKLQLLCRTVCDGTFIFSIARDKEVYLRLATGFDIVNSLPGVLTDSKKYSNMLLYNSHMRDLLHVLQPLCLMYKRGALPFYRQLPVTAVPFGERQTSGGVAAPVTFFKGSSCILSHLSHPPLWSERWLAGLHWSVPELW